MLLSEAMRFGAQKRPQGFGTCFPDDGKKSCAWGAVCEGILGYVPLADGNYTVDIFKTIREAVGIKGFITDIKVEHPIYREQGALNGLNAAITDLNDTHKWSREKIADWLESIGL